MPILRKSENWRAQVLAVREIRLGVPYDREAALRTFYGDLLGLREYVATPRLPGGWIAGDSRSRIYFQHRHVQIADPLRRRLTLTVPSMKRLEARLNEAAWNYRRHTGLNFGDDFLVLCDPAGHLIEIRQSQPL